MIFVDDGSLDASWSVIQEIAKEHPANVKAIRFRRNLERRTLWPPVGGRRPGTMFYLGRRFAG